MSAFMVPAVGAIAARLHDLVNQARNLKHSSSIDPPLPVSDLEPQASSIASVPNSRVNGTSVDLAGSGDALQPLKNNHGAFEAAARSVFYALTSANHIDSDSFVDVWNLLDILQLCADLEQCELALPLYLIEELLDSQTIGGCMKVFNYLESRRESLVATPHQSKKLILLRSCNDLLRRLSRAEDAVFCGRVFIFLFQSFPLGDKSAVNLRGDFHTENTTSFKLPPESGPDESNDNNEAEGQDRPNGETADTMEVDQKDQTSGTQNEANGDNSAKPADDQSKSVTFDAAAAKKPAAEGSSKEEQEKVLETRELYPIFWTLQQNFSNPTTLFNPDDLGSFKIGLEATLKKFKSMPKVLQAPHQGLNQLTKANNEEPREERGTKRRADGSEVGEPNAFSATFTPKYLTSYDLFELELSDLTFQRSVLVQSLIILDFLLSLTPTSKAKLTSNLTHAPNKAVIYAYTLSPADETWATKTRKSVADYLSEQSDGKFFYRMVQSVLSRDKNWSAWKASSCPPISLPPIPTASELEARKGAAQATEWKRLKVPPMSSIDLSFVTDEPDRAFLNDKMRWRRPEPEIAANGRQIDLDDARMMKWLRRIEEIDLDMEMETDETARRTLFGSRATASWRILRVLGTKDLTLFDKIGLNPEVGEDFTELRKHFEKKYEASIEEQAEEDAEMEDKAEIEQGDAETNQPDGDGEVIAPAVVEILDTSQETAGTKVENEEMVTGDDIEGGEAAEATALVEDTAIDELAPDAADAAGTETAAGSEGNA